MLSLILLLKMGMATALKNEDTAVHAHELTFFNDIKIGIE
jgi:hypothetical protein